jgi:glycine dehydrogenase
MPALLSHPDSFVRRHIGPSDADVAKMLETLGLTSLEALVAETVPAGIRLSRPLDLPAARTEAELLADARAIAAKNQVFRSFLGMGYSDTITPPVIQRNVIENPGWYTQYTPYQAEIAQGRLEALLNFQTMIIDLTGFPVANASLLDEGTAAAEAMHLMVEFAGTDTKKKLFVSDACHPQTIEVVRTRAEAIGIDVVVGDHRTHELGDDVFGAIVQYPATDGTVFDYRDFCAKAHAKGALVTVAADILSLAVLVPPGEFGADVAVGNTQRFGVPLGFGGPHAAYFSCKQDYVRKLPGRIIGVSKDSRGKPALRMALQTREQHIRREKATSNVCTAQALLAICAGFYAVYHGPAGIRAIAERVHGLTEVLASGLAKLGVKVAAGTRFDTVRVDATKDDVSRWIARAEQHRINLRRLSDTSLTIALDETVGAADLSALFEVFATGAVPFTVVELAAATTPTLPDALRRTSAYLTHPVFDAYHSETEMLRYMRLLESRDLSLTHAMIPLGSCTMKLNATAEMMPITWAEWNRIHPFAPTSQTLGYREIVKQLEGMLSECTGFPGISLQPNAGSQGEYAGLLVIRKFHRSRGDDHRTVCLIPASAHGTNPASAVMAGMSVVVVKCDDMGNIDLVDLESKAKEHAKNLGALMVTYPSTYGVFDEEIRRICEIVHANGGQVYMDGANMNAQVGLCRPADFGADVCHLNLHKTFCIPHGGGGPGMGPIGAAAHLAPFLPSHPVVPVGGAQGIGPISAAPWGSASILLISWAYVAMMGADGLKRATEVAILNANYVANRLLEHYPVVFRGKRGRVAHECIIDLRAFKAASGVEVDDVAKRLMDYGFHAPTMSFPIPATLMVEPTESESKAELDRFCDAMIRIRGEIRDVEEGKAPRVGNVLKGAPHTADVVAGDTWDRAYGRELAAFPAPWTRTRKFWPAVGRLDNAHGDRNLVCACIPIEDYALRPRVNRQDAGAARR